MWALDAAINAIGAGYGRRRWEDAVSNRWKNFEVGAISEATFLRLLERLTDTERYRIDAYGVVALACEQS